MKILIVDDDPDQRELLKGFLDHQGYETLTAGDGETALHLLKRETVQLVLLDHRMPGLTGDAVLAKIRETNPTQRVIMITAFGDVDMAVNAMKLGAFEFLEKPVNLSLLLQRIQQAEQAVVVEEDVALVSQAVDESPLPLKIVAESPAMKDVLSLMQGEWREMTGRSSSPGKPAPANSWRPTSYISLSPRARRAVLGG